MQDQMGNVISLNKIPERIVSLVPSQTELLFDLGLQEKIVGVTKFCIHPEAKVKKKQIVGGTKRFRFDTIDAIKPDLIIGNKEENYKAGIDKLSEKYPVWMSDIYTLEDALDMINTIAQLTGAEAKGHSIAQRIEANFKNINLSSPKKTLYFIWNNPFMVAGKNTFIDHMMMRAGLNNAVQKARYPELSAQEIAALNPEVILLSSEPFPFKDKHIDLFQDMCPKADIRIVDGEMFSWYGSRLIQAPEYFNALQL